MLQTLVYIMAIALMALFFCIGTVMLFSIVRSEVWSSEDRKARLERKAKEEELAELRMEEIRRELAHKD